MCQVIARTSRRISPPPWDNVGRVNGAVTETFVDTRSNVTIQSVTQNDNSSVVTETDLDDSTIRVSKDIIRVSSGGSLGEITIMGHIVRDDCWTSGPLDSALYH